MMQSMKPTVYVETSVVSYLTARPSRDLVTAAHQEVTREWWARAGDQFELVISPMVVREASRGDAEAAKARLSAIGRLRMLPLRDSIVRRVATLSTELDLPAKALTDIYHIAFCIDYEVDFLATWNSAHIANPGVLRPLRDLSHAEPFFLPMIVMPDALLEDWP